jgi:hypothetical protein
MKTNVFRYQFIPSLPVEEADYSLEVSVDAVEGLFGRASVRLDVSFYVDEPRNAIFVDGSNEIGDAFVRIFTNFLMKELGEDAFQVCRVEACPAPRTEGRAA